MSNEPSAHRHTARSLQGLCMRAAVRLRRNRSVGLLEPWRVQSARAQQCTRRFSIITRRLDHRGSWRSWGRRGGSCVLHTTDISPTAPRRLVFPTPPIPSAKHPHRSAANTKSLSQRITQSFCAGWRTGSEALEDSGGGGPEVCAGDVAHAHPDRRDWVVVHIHCAHPYDNSQQFSTLRARLSCCKVVWGTRGGWAFARARKWMGEETMLMAAGTPSCATVAAELPRYGTSSGSTIGGNVNPYSHQWVSKSHVGGVLVVGEGGGAHAAVGE